jgi:hypothetical protein
MLKASSSMSDSVYDPYGNRYNFFNVRVFPATCSAGTAYPACLRTSLEEASLFFQVSQAMSVNSITVSSNFLRLKPTQRTRVSPLRLKPGGLQRVNYGQNWVWVSILTSPAT